MFLPLFPLSVVVFPGELLPLHIFEPRYRQLIRESVDSRSTFGIPPAIEGRLALFGTEVEVIQVMKTYPSGESDVLTRGVSVFRIDEFKPEVPEKLYAGGVVTPVENNPIVDPMVQDELLATLHRIEALVNAQVRLVEPEQLSFAVARQIGLGLAQKLEILAQTEETARQAIVLGHLKKALPIIEKNHAKDPGKPTTALRMQYPPSLN